MGYGQGQRLAPHLMVEAEIAYKPGPRVAPVLVRKHYVWPLLGSTLEFALAEQAKAAPAAPPREQPPAGAALESLPPYFGGLDPQKASKAAAGSLALRQTLTLKRDPVTGTLQDPSEDDAEFQGRIFRVRERPGGARRRRRWLPCRQLEKAEDRVRKAEFRLDSGPL